MASTYVVGTFNTRISSFKISRQYNFCAQSPITDARQFLYRLTRYIWCRLGLPILWSLWDFGGNSYRQLSEISLADPYRKKAKFKANRIAVEAKFE